MNGREAQEASQIMIKFSNGIKSLALAGATSSYVDLLSAKDAEFLNTIVQKNAVFHGILMEADGSVEGEQGDPADNEDADTEEDKLFAAADNDSDEVKALKESLFEVVKKERNLRKEAVRSSKTAAPGSQRNPGKSTGKPAVTPVGTDDEGSRDEDDAITPKETREVYREARKLARELGFKDIEDAKRINPLKFLDEYNGLDEDKYKAAVADLKKKAKHLFKEAGNGKTGLTLNGGSATRSGSPDEGGAKLSPSEWRAKFKNQKS